MTVSARSVRTIGPLLPPAEGQAENRDFKAVKHRGANDKIGVSDDSLLAMQSKSGSLVLVPRCFMLDCMNAWLLTWEGTEGPALVSDKKIVAIISGRLSSKTIEEVVDILYRRSIGSAYDMASLANKRKQREDQYRHFYSQQDRFFYGTSKLCIYARKVFNLKVERDKSQQIERVQWTEFPYQRIKELETMPQEIEPVIEKELLRKLDEPLAFDIYEHEE